MSRLKVAILAGGRSSEHEISLASARSVLESLDPVEYDVVTVATGVAASALCMDKDLFKKVLRDSGVPVARHVALREGDAVQNPFGFPCFVKPARLGSSVGITKAHDEGELRAAVELAFRHDDKILIEEFLGGIEVEVGVLGNREPVASI